MKGLVEVHLWGVLAEKFGPEHRYAIATPAEAFRALEANHPGFRRELVKHKGYYILADGDWRDADSFLAPVSRDLHIVPHVEGQGLEVMFAGWLASTFFAGSMLAGHIVATVIIVGLMVGVSLLLAPKPKKKTTDDKKDDSFMFSGPEQTVGQGAAVPLIYGRCWVGPTVVSAGVETGDQYIQTATGVRQL